MTHDEALAYWFAHVNWEQRTPGAADLGLERMRVLLARLGNPHRVLRIVHVAGSKGKGSTSAMLASILQKAGYRTGLFTSPHLCGLEERFQVDGKAITPEETTVLLSEVREAIEGGKSNPSPQYRAHSPSEAERGEPETPPLRFGEGVGGRGLSPGPPTFFEIATALGFLHFVRRRVDVAILEVGLGGRLDSTNVCLPLVSIITSISFDHTAILGDRLASIAREKAGIVKPRRPVLSGATVPEARAIIEAVCARQRAPLRQLGVDFHYESTPGRVIETGIVRPRFKVMTRQRRWPIMELNLLGDHQAANAAVTVACVEELQKIGLHISEGAVSSGLRDVYWPARMEVVGRHPLVVLDCAHNVASAVALVETLQSSFPPVRRVLIFAASCDKDVPGMFRVMAPHFAAAFVTRFTNNPRAEGAERLAELWRAAGSSPVTVCARPVEALEAAQKEAGTDGLVCIAGSVFLAGELRQPSQGALWNQTPSG
jgi:dihydrofolate synthase/folylpolyglutamate synthase